MKSVGLDLFCMVSSCPPEDWDCEGLLTCDEKDPGSVNQGLMISGTDPQSREIHCGDQVMLKSQQTNKYCSPSDPNSMSIVSCAERHYDDESLFVIQKVDHRIAGDEESMRYPGWGPDQPSGSTPPGPDVVKTVIRFHPADSPHSWCHVFRSQDDETNGIRCGGSFVKGMELFEVVDVGGGGGSWVPPSQGHLDDEEAEEADAKQ